MLRISLSERQVWPSTYLACALARASKICLTNAMLYHVQQQVQICTAEHSLTLIKGLVMHAVF